MITTNNKGKEKVTASSEKFMQESSNLSKRDAIKNNPYQFLNLSEGASWDEVDSAYCQLDGYYRKRVIYTKRALNLYHGGDEKKRAEEVRRLEMIQKAFYKIRSDLVGKQEEERERERKLREEEREREKSKLVVYEGECEEEFEDFYKILGVDKNSSAEMIAKAYKKLALEWHPDKNKSRLAETKFRKINQAYEILSDAKLRELYDKHGDREIFEQNMEWNESIKKYEQGIEKIKREDKIESVIDKVSKAFFDGKAGRFAEVREEELNPNLWGSYESWEDKFEDMVFIEGSYYEEFLSQVNKFRWEMETAIEEVRRKKDEEWNKEISRQIKENLTRLETVGSSSHVNVTNIVNHNNFTVQEIRGETASDTYGEIGGEFWKVETFED